jgi:SAM-dependent methyltransferase
MSQNIYDSAAFFQSYSQYPRALDGLKGASEWPLLRSMLPRDIKAKTILDLGCGDGWFCRWAVSRGATEVCGIDVSKNMLDRARVLSAPETYPSISFYQVDISALSLDQDVFDLVFSALALHYLVDLEAAVREIYTSLRPGGFLVFSVEHPIFTAPRRPGFNTPIDDRSGAKHWLLSDYFAEGERTVN